MAISFHDLTSTQYADETNTTINKPAATASGDILLLVAFLGKYSPQDQTCTGPANFNLITGFPTWSVVDQGPFGMGTWAWWKLAGESEPSTYTVTHTGYNSISVMIAISGADTTTPFAPNPTINTNKGQTSTALSITTARNDSLVIYLGQDWAYHTTGVDTVPGTTPTFVERLDVATNNLLTVDTGVLATAGATGDKSITNSNTGNFPWQAFLFAVQPPAGGGPTPISVADSGIGADAITGQLITFTNPSYGSSTASISGIDPTDWVNPGSVYADDTSYATWSP